MKKSNLLTCVLVVLAGITSCTDDSFEFTNQVNEIRLTSEIIPSRVAYSNYQSTQIVEEQKVGVTITGARSTHKNVAWTVGAYGDLNNTGEVVYWAKGDVAITAYHPYNSAWTGTSYDFSVSTDQSNEANYRNSDLLWTTTTSSITEMAVPLIFTHKLAKVNITLSSDDIEDLSGATVSICGTNVATRFNPSSGVLSAATANVADIVAGVTMASHTVSAIVVPQTVAGGTKFIRIEHGDKTFHYTLPSDKELKSGYSHNYTLAVSENKTEIVLCSDNITNWINDNNSGNAVEDVVKVPNNEVWYTTTDGEIVNLSSVENNYGNRVSDNVYKDGKGIILFSGGDLKSIGNTAFMSCTNLKSVVIPDCVTHIEPGAFQNCTSLTSINIPDNVIRIDAAFLGCSALTSISIPKNVTQIAQYAFSDCTSLTRVEVKATVPPTIFSETFDNSTALKIYVPKESIDAYKAANYWKDLNLLAK